MRDTDVIQHIKDLCAERHWSYYRLAQEAGIPYSTISNMIHRTYSHHSHASEDVRRLWHDPFRFLYGHRGGGSPDRTSAGSAGAVREAERRRQKAVHDVRPGTCKNIVGQADKEAVVKAILKCRQPPDTAIIPGIIPYHGSFTLSISLLQQPLYHFQLFVQQPMGVIRMQFGVSTFMGLPFMTSTFFS